MIKCSIDFNLKNASIFIDDCFIETKSFNDLNFKKETSTEFKICNDLYLINKISIYLKLKYNAKEKDTLFIIDNDDIYKLLKPDNVLIKKLTKSMKKNILNNELKLILGSTLFEMNSIQNVDLILQETKNMKGDDSMLNNTSVNDFNLKEEVEFDLDEDFDFDLDAPIEPAKKDTTESSFSEDFSFDLDDDISLSPFNLTNNNSSELNSLDTYEVDSESIIDNKTYLNNEVIIEDNVEEKLKDEEVNIEEELKDEEINSISEESLNNNLEESVTKNDEVSVNENTKKQDALRVELLKEFENMERYLDEQIDSLQKQSKNLEDENSKLKLNFNDLNIDEEIIIANFNKSMEIRLRLKVIKKSCKIYNNIKTQLEDELSKF